MCREPTRDIGPKGWGESMARGTVSTLGVGVEWPMAGDTSPRFCGHRERKRTVKGGEASGGEIRICLRQMGCARRALPSLAGAICTC